MDGLWPEFPPLQEATSLVLYPGSTRALRASWSIQANDFVSYGAGFPAAGGPPQAVLRLCRLRQDGGTETTQETSLRLKGLGGRGDTQFEVDADFAQFEAELGLINTDGGWLLLARSNRIQHANGVALESLDLGAARELRDVLTAPAVALSPGPALKHQADRPAPGRLGLRPGPAAFEGDARMGIGAPDSVFAERALELRWPPGQDPQSPPPGESPGTEPPGTDPQVQRHDLRHPAADPGPSEERNATLSAVPIPGLVYGRPSSTGAGLVLEAELHLRGWAAPNSQIDLFGQPYRVGPGGRFQLVLRVDDPELLRRALALHPPPELRDQRDD